jgi:hypothetical protein
MSNTSYQFSVPLLRRGFTVLSSYLAIVGEFVKLRSLPESDILNATLAPDMLSLSGQIQRASDKAKSGIARLAQVEAPSFPDSEKSIAELRERIDKTDRFLRSVRPTKFEGADLRIVELRFKSINGVMAGDTYLTQVLLPDFYFHIATAHAILRNKGLSVGKADYLGKPDYL